MILLLGKFNICEEFKRFGVCVCMCVCVCVCGSHLVKPENYASWFKLFKP